MSENKEKRFCVVDHANKLGERQARNPNRLKRTREQLGRWVARPQDAPDDKNRDPAD